MRVGAIVQARMQSSRCPAKVLRDCGGRPMLDCLLTSLSLSEVETVLVATSVEASDDPIEQHCQRVGIPCIRGDLENVADRFRVALEAFPWWDAFVRLCADSPLLDFRLVNQALRLASTPGVDLVTNVFPRTYPPGQSVEVVRATTFRTALERMSEPSQLEHVTSYFYQHSSDFHILNFTSEEDYSGLRMAVDTASDLAWIQQLIANLPRPHWEYTVAELAARCRRPTQVGATRAA